MRSVAWGRSCYRRPDFSNTCRVIRQISHGRRSNTFAADPHLFVQIRTFRNTGIALNSDPTFLSPFADAGFVQSQQSREAILERAKIHGIYNWKKLDFEAGVRGNQKTIKYMLNDRNIRQDLDLWAIVLDYRQLKDGSRGVRDILSAMLYRPEIIRLQADSVSRHIWDMVLPVVLADDRLLYRLCRIGAGFMDGRPNVFSDIVGQLLASGRLHLAISIGTQFLTSKFRGRSDIMNLFDITFQQETDEAMQNFYQLISRLPRYRIYSDVIPRLWTAGRKKHAFISHRLLLQLGDYPTTFEQIEPFIEEMAARNSSLEPFLSDLEQHGISYTHQARQFYKLEKTRIMTLRPGSINSHLYPGPGTRPIKLSDAFVARTFATRSVSFEFVLNGLRFIGLFEIGPLAVREMAIAARDYDDLRCRFRRLEAMEVDLGASNYVQVVRKLCMSGQDSILQDILDSDMHSEVFDDVQKQKRLLADYYRRNDRAGVNRTLAILNEGDTSEQAAQRSARLILQATLIEGKWRDVLQSLDGVRETYEFGSQESRLSPLRLALRRIWAEASSSAAGDQSYLIRPNYLAGFMQLARSAGLQVHPWQWRTALYAVGKSGDWASFHCLTYSVARMLSNDMQPGVKSTSTTGEIDRNVNDLALNDPNLQCFVLETGLTARDRDQGPESTWLRGVNFLHTLKTDFGMHMDYHMISRALRIRLHDLFSDADNGTRQRAISRYLRCYNWAWTKAGLTFGPGRLRRGHNYAKQTPDAKSLELLQLRSRSARFRRNVVGPEIEGWPEPTFTDIHHVDGSAARERPAKHCEKLQLSEAGKSAEGADEHNISAVFYEDLLHPSYGKAVDVRLSSAVLERRPFSNV